MQGTKPKQEEKKNARERAYLAGLKTVACWRGYGGVACGRRLRAALLLLTVAKNFFLLPYPSFFFVLSGCLFLVWFWFLGFGFLPSGLLLFSLLSLASGLSSSLSRFFLFFGSPSILFFLLIYRKQNGAGTTFVRAFNSATAGRPLGRVRWRWGRGERRGRIFEIFSSSVMLKRGEGGR